MVTTGCCSAGLLRSPGCGGEGCVRFDGYQSVQATRNFGDTASAEQGSPLRVGFDHLPHFAHLPEEVLDKEKPTMNTSVRPIREIEPFTRAEVVPLATARAWHFGALEECRRIYDAIGHGVPFAIHIPRLTLDGYPVSQPGCPSELDEAIQVERSGFFFDQHRQRGHLLSATDAIPNVLKEIHAQFLGGPQ